MMKPEGIITEFHFLTQLWDVKFRAQEVHVHYHIFVYVKQLLLVLFFNLVTLSMMVQHNFGIW